MAHFALAGVLTLWLAQTYGERLVERFVPVFNTALAAVQDDFAILEVSIAHETAGAVMRVRADFAHPFYVAGHVLYPMNSAGWMQVDLTVGGVLEYFVMTAVILLAWPWDSLREYGLRLAIGIPLGTLLAISAAINTILAELWFPVHADLAATEVWPVLVSSRFLMGGGGFALAISAAAVAIALGGLITTRAASTVPDCRYA